MGQGLTAGPLDLRSQEPWARVLRPTWSQGSRCWREEGTRGEEVGTPVGPLLSVQPRALLTQRQPLSTSPSPGGDVFRPGGQGLGPLTRWGWADGTGRAVCWGEPWPGAQLHRRPGCFLLTVPFPAPGPEPGRGGS